MTAFAVIVTVVFSGRWFVKAQTIPRYDVFLDDQLLGTVSDPELVKSWKLERYREVEREHSNLRVTSNLEKLNFVSNPAFNGAIDNDAVIAALNKKIVYYFFAVEIRIDGESIGYVKDLQTAAELLEQIKAPYKSAAEAVPAEPKRKLVRALSANGTTGQVEGLAEASVEESTIAEEAAAAVPASSLASSFVQDVSLVETILEPGKVESSEAIKQRILAGKVVPETYTVQSGDCMSMLASRFQMPIETLRANNPEVRGDLIRVGQQLRITVQQPMLTVKTTEVRTEQHKVPSGVKYEKDPELKAGVIQIVSQGKPGLKKVMIQSVKLNGKLAEESLLHEEVLEEAVQTVVRQGTKVIPGVGTGKFSMPVLRGEVTSQFGLRWGKSHKGTDFVSKERSIMASDHGKVIFAGWKSGYGNCIIIDHQNGYETLYGHLSKISVKEGESVTKGEKIGIMGSTGNSTGVHLHFEIMKNGIQHNPMKFLS